MISLDSSSSSSFLMNRFDRNKGEELKRLKERNQMSDSADTIKYDHHAEIMEVNRNINHEEKMKRTTDRM